MSSPRSDPTRELESKDLVGSARVREASRSSCRVRAPAALIAPHGAAPRRPRLEGRGPASYTGQPCRLPATSASRAVRKTTQRSALRSSRPLASGASASTGGTPTSPAVGVSRDQSCPGSAGKWIKGRCADFGFGAWTVSLAAASPIRSACSASSGAPDASSRAFQTRSRSMGPSPSRLSRCWRGALKCSARKGARTKPRGLRACVSRGDGGGGPRWSRPIWLRARSGSGATAVACAGLQENCKYPSRWRGILHVRPSPRNDAFGLEATSQNLRRPWVRPGVQKRVGFWTRLEYATSRSVSEQAPRRVFRHPPRMRCGVSSQKRLPTERCARWPRPALLELVPRRANGRAL